MGSLRQLPVDRLLRRPVAKQRHAGAHVQRHCGDGGYLRGVGALHACAGDHQPWAALCIVQHFLTRAHGNPVGSDPGRIVGCQHKVPCTIGAGMQHRHRCTGVERRFLEAVDIMVVGGAEHALRGGEGAQCHALHHQCKPWRDLRRQCIQCQGVAQRRKARGIDAATLAVVQRTRRHGRQCFDARAHLGRWQHFGQLRQVVHGAIVTQQTRIEAGDLCGSHTQRLRVVSALDPVVGGQLRIAGRKRCRVRYRVGRRCRSGIPGQSDDQQQQRQQAARQWHEEGS